MSEWPTMTLAQAGVALIDCVHATPAAMTTGLPYIAIPQMKDGRLDFDGARKISRADFIEWTRKARPQRHDIVLSRRTNPGVIAPVLDDTEFALGQNLVLLRADGATVAPPFLRWLASSPYWWEQIAKFNNVGAIFDSLRCADVPNFELPIPPIREQLQIADLLAALDGKIELNRRMNATLERQARALFRDWFVDFGPTRAKQEGAPAYLAPDLWNLFPATLDPEGKPEGWETADIYRIADVIYGAPFASDRFNSQGEGRPLVRIRDLPNHSGGVFTDEIHKKEYLIKPGDIVVGMDGEFRAYLWQGEPSLMNQRVCCFSPKLTRDRGFLWLAIEPHLASCEGSAIGTTVIHLGKKDIDRFDAISPGQPILEAFSKLVEPLIDRLVANGQESRTLAQTRDLLLPKLMSGEIRVREAERAMVAAF